MAEPTRELFDATVDVHHRSYLLAMVGDGLADNSFVCFIFFICNLYALCFIYFVLLKCVMYLVVGYVSSACFSLYRMLEAIVGLGEGANRGAEKSVQLDRDLLATLFDR
jgi:hypothetical protein